MIRGLRYCVLNILDVFSRYIVVWGIVKTVTHSQVKDVMALAMINEEIDTQKNKPILRHDPGSPNMAVHLRRFLQEIRVTFSPGRVARSTDYA